MMSDPNLFDALNEALDRLERVEGHKYIVLIASGRDTFSRLTLDKILKRVKASQDITIYTVSTGGAMRAVTEGRGGTRGEIRDLDYLQADNQMKTFAAMTGGASYSPDFPQRCPTSLARLTRTSAQSMSWSTRPLTPSRTAPGASSA